MRSPRRPPELKIEAYSRAKRAFSPNNYVIEYENALARFPHNPSSASRHLSRGQRGGLHNSPALAAWGGTVFHGGQMGQQDEAADQDLGARAVGNLNCCR